MCENNLFKCCKYHHTYCQNNIFLDVFKVCKPQQRAEQFMELFNVSELKILGYHLRVFRSSREFLLLPLILAELCLGANTAASQVSLLQLSLFFASIRPLFPRNAWYSGYFFLHRVTKKPAFLLANLNREIYIYIYIYIYIITSGNRRRLHTVYSSKKDGQF